MCKRVSDLRNKTAHELLVIGGQDNKVPVNMRALLEKLGISYKPYDFSEIERMAQKQRPDGGAQHILGALVTSGDNALILCSKNEAQDSHRNRFTIAHELGHCCLAHQEIRDPSVHLRLEGDPVDDEEKAANIFAGELLVPQNELKKSIDKLFLPSVHSLANIFAVSENVMKARLEYLKLKEQIIGYNC